MRSLTSEQEYDQEALETEKRLRESYKFLQGHLYNQGRPLKELDTIWVEVLQYIDLIKGKVLPD